MLKQKHGEFEFRRCFCVSEGGFSLTKTSWSAGEVTHDQVLVASQERLPLWLRAKQTWSYPLCSLLFSGVVVPQLRPWPAAV